MHVSHKPRPSRRHAPALPASRRGFTIIELLIATAVFAVILLVVISGVLQFTREYYKGVISSNTQNAARSLADDVTRTIQFGDAGAITPLHPSSSSPAVTGYCIGTSKRYSFAPNYELSGSVQHVLVTDSGSGCGPGTLALNPAAPGFTMPSGGRELLGDNMRVSKFTITQLGSTDTYDVSVRVVYGDDDLLCSPGIAPASAGGCNPSAPAGSQAVFGTHNDLVCRINAGSQFCAVSQLDTTVEKRVQ